MTVLQSVTSGEAGIRTLGTREGSTVFETAPFNRSGTSPTPASASEGRCQFTILLHTALLSSLFCTAASRGARQHTDRPDESWKGLSVDMPDIEKPLVISGCGMYYGCGIPWEATASEETWYEDIYRLADSTLPDAASQRSMRHRCYATESS